MGNIKRIIKAWNPRTKAQSLKTYNGISAKVERNKEKAITQITQDQHSRNAKIKEKYLQLKNAPTIIGEPTERRRRKLAKAARKARIRSVIQAHSEWVGIRFQEQKIERAQINQAAYQIGAKNALDRIGIGRSPQEMALRNKIYSITKKYIQTIGALEEPTHLPKGLRKSNYEQNIEQYNKKINRYEKRYSRIITNLLGPIKGELFKGFSQIRAITIIRKAGYRPYAQIKFKE